MDTTDAKILQQVGLNLKAERSRRDLTQEAVARLSGLGPTQIARMERGETDTGISKYLRVARAIGMNPADLFFGMSDQFGYQAR